MALAIWQATIVDAAGNIQPGAQVYVRDADTNELAVLKPARDGSGTLGNPFAADSQGFAQFYTGAGRYKITAQSALSTRVWEHVVLLEDAPSDESSLPDTVTGDFLLDQGAGLTAVNFEEAVRQFASIPTVRGATFLGFNQPIAVPVNDVSVPVAYDGEIKKVIVLTKGGSGNCVVDIWKDGYGDYPPTEVDSICSSTKPTIVAGIKYEDATLAGWDIYVSNGDVLTFHLASNSLFTAIAVFVVIAPVGAVDSAEWTDDRVRDIVEEALEDGEGLPLSVPAVPDTIPMRDEAAYVYAATPAPGDSSTKVATTEFVDRGSSLGASGYVIHPSGLIEQWGYDVRTGSSAQTVTFPIPFPTACDWVGLTVHKSSGTSAGQTPAVIGTPGDSSFSLAHADSTAGAFWTAKGR